MKEDIATPEVIDVAVAAAPRREDGEELWDIYLINLREETLENVLITSQGYGSIDGIDKTTTVLRYFHQTLGPREAIKVEPIQPALFTITNEYWVSFNAGGQMLDKRYRFAAGTISRDALEEMEVLDRPAVVMQ